MSEKAHIIEIDSIVLSGVDLRNPIGLSALIETEVCRALQGTGLSMLTEDANTEQRVGGEVAQNVVHSLQGRE